MHPSSHRSAGFFLRPAHAHAVQTLAACVLATLISCSPSTVRPDPVTPFTTPPPAPLKPPTSTGVNFRCQSSAPTPIGIRIFCSVDKAVPYSIEWRLFGVDEDMLTDFNSGRTFHFIAPHQWRVLEMKAYDGEQLVARKRMRVRHHGQSIEYGEF